MKTLLGVIIVYLTFACSTDKQRENYFVPGEIWYDTDGVPINAHGLGALLHDAIYFIYGQHMVEGEAGNRAQVGVRCYSSKNLYDWKNEGVALKVVDGLGDAPGRRVQTEDQPLQLPGA